MPVLRRQLPRLVSTSVSWSAGGFPARRVTASPLVGLSYRSDTATRRFAVGALCRGPLLQGVEKTAQLAGNSDASRTSAVAADDECSEAPPLDTAATTAAAPPPPRRVRRFYIPGIDGAEPAEGSSPAAAAVKEKAAGTAPPSPPNANGPSAAATSKGNAPDTAASATAAGASTAAAGGGETKETDGSAPRPAPVEEVKKDTAPLDATAVHAENGSASPDADTQEARGKKKGTPPPRSDGAAAATVTHAALPNALVHGLQERNKRIKTMLVAAMGSEFAKAGIHNDGVRTSFSVVNYQTVRQKTGLKRVPTKLLVSCLTSPDGTIDWIDISAHPTATLTEYKEAVQEVLVGLGMHSSMVDDCAEPMLLPQATLTKEVRSLLLRYAIDPSGGKRMDSFQDLTNRFTLFITTDRVITVHRTQCTYVEELKKNWHAMLEEENGRVARFLLYYFVKETVQTFMHAISRCIVEFDRYEASLFATTRARASLAREIYHIKRRAAVYGRTLTITKDAYTHMAASMNVYSSNVRFQEVAHDLAHMESLAEELNANADSVLQLLFQLSSYQVNELMRVLTLFSAFFIPLGFIAGLYGMNFENLPFLHAEHGEAYCALLMASVTAFIYFWFKAKRFI